MRHVLRFSQLTPYHEKKIVAMTMLQNGELYDDRATAQPLDFLCSLFPWYILLCIVKRLHNIYQDHCTTMMLKARLWCTCDNGSRRALLVFTKVNQTSYIYDITQKNYCKVWYWASGHREYSWWLYVPPQSAKLIKRKVRVHKKYNMQQEAHLCEKFCGWIDWSTTWWERLWKFGAS